MKRKKLWITLAVICVCIFALGLTFGLVFRLKVVDVEFLEREGSETTHLSPGIIEKVKTDGEFKFGKNIVFLKFDDSVAKIEEKNPYIKVNQVIKNFPNIVRVYITERLPRYRVKGTKNGSDDFWWLILDDEFKILERVANSSLKDEFFETTVEIEPETFSVSDETLKPGKFISLKNGYDEFFNVICDTISEVNTDSVPAYSIAIKFESDGEYVFQITMRNSSLSDKKGCKILIKGIDELSEKVYRGISVFESQIKAELNLPENTFVVEKVNGKIDVRKSN